MFVAQSTRKGLVTSGLTANTEETTTTETQEKHTVQHGNAHEEKEPPNTETMTVLDNNTPPTPSPHVPATVAPQTVYNPRSGHSH